MLLINPPLTKPSEPPAGITKLSGFLKGHGIKHRVLDANMEGLYSILEEKPDLYDTWTKRASKNLSQNLAYLKGTYHNFDTYKRAVMDINRLIEIKGKTKDIHLSLSDYRSEKLSPVRSDDLIKAAENPEINPFYPYFNGRFREIIEKEEPEIIGFSLNYLSQALSTFSMAGFLKETHPSLKIVLGGGLVTSWVRNPEWKNPFTGLIDYFVDGPGEYELLSILGKKSIEGDFIPDYDSLPLKDYISAGIILPYSTSTGCYWNKCSFCPERAEKTPYKSLSPRRVISELNILIERTKPFLIHLLDNAISPLIMKKLIKNPLPVPWYGFTRITEDLADMDFCMDLKKSGCVMLKLGLESGSQYVLDSMQKNIDLKIASISLKNLKKAGIGTYVYLLFGTPQETLIEARKTLDFTVSHSKYINFLNIAIFNMPVYGPDSIKANKKNFYEGDLSLYTDFIHHRGWNRKEVRQFLYKEFKKERVIADIIKRNPPFFTSNHAPFFIRAK
jgi:radical SAM superfamily enzyme YgiQ (UPF0313 family)